MAKSNIVRGTMMLSGANFLSKLLGMLYTIPFFMLVGGTGGALYNYAYVPYMIFISIATLGIPLAMSKFVSKYHSMGDYATKESMFRTGMAIMIGTGFVAFAVMFLSAGWLAGLVIPNEKMENSVEDVKFVIQMVSFALLIIPPMSLVRGYFQGHESMGPTAVSVVVEQIVRIGFVLAGAFVVIHVLGGTVTFAVGVATFAAFIGAIASALVLLGYYKKRRPLIEKEMDEAEVESSFTRVQMTKELLSYAGPFVLVGIATPLYQLVDQFTFNRAMAQIGQAGISEDLFSVISFYGHKLAIIPVTLATGLSLAVLPAITGAFTRDDYDEYTHYINQALLIIIFIILPAVVGLSLLSDQAYGSFYSVDSISYAGPLLAYYAPVALFFALFTVSASILQGINRQNFTLLSLSTGLGIKIIANVPFIMWFGAKGAVFATGLAVITASAMNLIKIYRVTRFNIRPLFKKTLLIAIMTTVMGTFVLLANMIVGSFFAEEPSKLKLITQLVFSVGIGAYIYFVIAYHTTLLERLLGSRVKRFSKVFFDFK
ncbi:cell division protein [Halalkalibacillus sediminis]|uniref:Cell division protein n=1 Tax=Halalkalibacillus sediminis TaxID=2018042 RepID=A0A2I0QYE9_9BACI|nr:polysaccharide biosynthesis protein [Halalkalibacillus sediminis]PKR79338.1 cell division protein [Halalkalibacillus sediminis]